MEIREATRAEHTEAGRVTAAAYQGLVRDPSYLERIADVADRARRTIVLVAVEDHAIVGSLTLEVSRRVNVRDDPLEAHRAHIRMLGVAPGHQGRGIGTALMREAETRALAIGKTEITLHTTEPMTAA
jgi:ribosomal protein S18 acetylase RimI-like enzyme